MEATIPFFGRVLISTSLCRNCGYRHSDTIPLEDHGPKREVLKVRKPQDLKTKIARSNTGSIEIPEFGLRIDPRGQSQSFITNVEGILLRFQDAIVRLKTLKSSDEQAKLDELMGQIELARGGRVPFTVIVEDPLGNTAIIKEYEIS